MLSTPSLVSLYRTRVTICSIAVSRSASAAIFTTCSVATRSTAAGWPGWQVGLNFYLDPAQLRPGDGRLLEFLAAENGFSVSLCQGVEPLPSLQRLPDDAPHASIFNRNIDRMNQQLLDGQDLVFDARRG